MFYAFHGSDSLLDVRGTMAAVHAFYIIYYTRVCLCFVVMVVMLFPWPKGTYQAGEQEGCAEVGEDADTFFVTGGIVRDGRVEPLARQQVVDAETKDDSSHNYGNQIDEHGTFTQHFTHYQYAGSIACRPSHEQNQGGSRRQSFQHQRHCNRDAAGGAKVHGDAEKEHEENAVERVVLKDNKPRIGNGGRYDASHNKTYCQPLPNVLHHLSESIGKSTKESF